MTFSDVFNKVSDLYGGYNESKIEANKTEQAQLNYQASLNNVGMSKDSIVKIGIIGLVLVVIGFFIFKR